GLAFPPPETRNPSRGRFATCATVLGGGGFRHRSVAADLGSIVLDLDGVV
ncbi:hypothetical protein A2U01_0077091, partial [Trifolium medium]|nr:hypothetical protein [Trifolium medium]